MSVSIQQADFDLAAELADMRASHSTIGALVTFTGIVRQNADNSLQILELEHYPAMTQSALEAMESEATRRWSLTTSRIIHRVGPLTPGAQIMMVATAAPHRQDAFDAAQFLMDFLKSRAPFWKKEHTDKGAEWVDARETDAEALKRWD